LIFERSSEGGSGVRRQTVIVYRATRMPPFFAKKSVNSGVFPKLNAIECL
jgi:hypothetical protein